jgi:hypothetical protein
MVAFKPFVIRSLYALSLIICNYTHAIDSKKRRRRRKKERPYRVN